MTKLPSGWRHVRIGDVAETALGKMLDKGRPRGYPHVPYLRNVNVQWGRVDTSDLLTMELADSDRERFGVRKGDLLVCEGGQPGRAAVWDRDGDYIAYQKALHRVRPRDDEADARFLMYAFQHAALTGALDPFTTGSTIAHLPQQNLQQVPLALPPTAEQRRIVAILEEHLSHLDGGLEAISRAERRADSFTAANVLRVLAEAGGDLHMLGQIASDVSNGIFVSRAGSDPDGVPILRIGAVRRMSLDLTSSGYSRLPEAEIISRGAELLPGDLLFTRYNGNPEYVAACAMVPSGAGAFTYPDKLIRVRIDRSRALPEFIAFASSFGPLRSELRTRVKTTAGQAGISGRDLKTVTVRVPSLEAQQDVIRAGHAALEVTRGLQYALGLVRRRHERLRISLLDAAFSGRLTVTSDRHEVEELAGV